MSNKTTDEYNRRTETFEGWEIGISSFEAEGRWYCHIDDVDPGARIASGEGNTQEEAERMAMEHARGRLAGTPAPAKPG